MWPLSNVAKLSEQLGMTCPLPQEKVIELANDQDDFTCSDCDAPVKTTRVEVSEILTDVVQSIRHGHCSVCKQDVQHENRFYRGNIAAKHGGEWYVLIIRPSLLERIWYRLRH
jgi:hypothetical protein